MMLSIDFSFSCFCGVVVWCCNRIACSVSVGCCVFFSFPALRGEFTENWVFGDCVVVVQLFVCSVRLEM
jgi:hypothetical protein